MSKSNVSPPSLGPIRSPLNSTATLTSPQNVPLTQSQPQPQPQQTLNNQDDDGFPLILLTSDQSSQTQNTSTQNLQNSQSFQTLPLNPLPFPPSIVMRVSSNNIINNNNNNTNTNTNTNTNNNNVNATTLSPNSSLSPPPSSTSTNSLRPNNDETKKSVAENPRRSILLGVTSSSNFRGSRSIAAATWETPKNENENENENPGNILAVPHVGDHNLKESDGLVKMKTPKNKASKRKSSFMQPAKNIFFVPKRIWITSVVVILGMASLIGILCAFLAPDVKISGSPIFRWAVYIDTVVLSFILCRFITIGLVSLCQSTMFLQQNVFYYAVGLQNSVWVVLWGTVLVTCTRPILSLPTSPKIENSLEETELTFRIMIYLGLWYCLKVVLVKFLAAKLNRKTFYENIKNSVFNERILETLVTGTPILRGSQKVLGKDSKEKDIEKQVKQAVKRGPILDFRSWVDSVRQWHHLNPNMTDIQGEVSIQDAMDYTTDIFFNVDQEGKDYLTKADFKLFMKTKYVERAWKIFGGLDDQNSQLSRDEVLNAILKILKERKSLFIRLQDHEDIGNVLNEIFSYSFWILMFLFVLYEYGVNVSVLLVPFGTIILGLSFVFGGTIRNIFESLILIFFVRPFDVGDKVVLDSKDTLIVKKVGLLYTEFYADGKAVIFPNALLNGSKIENLNRSEEVCVSLKLMVKFDTPLSQIYELEKKISEYLKNNAEHWKPDYTLTIAEFTNTNNMEIKVGASILAACSESSKWRPIKKDFLFKMRDWTMEIGLKTSSDLS